jgi:hypothetical protein
LAISAEAVRDAIAKAENVLFTYPRFLFLKDLDDQWHHVEIRGLAEKLRWVREFH